MRRWVLSLCLLAVLGAQAGNDDILRTMKRATHYMMDSLSYRGGFVWNYLPDHSRQWGEMEAYPTMIWMQSPSTPDVGQLLLDAYHATGDEYYYEQAGRVAQALMGAQLKCGGWNYMHDFAGKRSMQQWYATIGRQAWRLEEFQHYYGNATFDDEATAGSAEFLLRFYMEKHDKQAGKAVEKVIGFILKSQYKNGGWPQRYPIMTDHPFRGKADYTPFVTLNDNVMMANIEFLIHCYHALGRTDLEQPILHAMYLLRDLQQQEPLAGWADQYTQRELLPAHARSYEPRAINPATTVQMMHRLARFYTMTGDRSFLQGFDRALRFVASQQLPDSVKALWKGRSRSSDEILVPRFIDPDTRLPQYVHRKGSNVKNGTYYTDQDIRATIGHYSSAAFINIRQIEEFCRQAPLAEVVSWKTPQPLPRYYYNMYARPRRGRRLSVERIIGSLSPQGYWLSTLGAVSNPYRPIPADMPSESDDRAFGGTMVGDEYDTSPYPDHRTKGISTQNYIQNMCALIRELRGGGSEATAGNIRYSDFESTADGKPTALYTIRNRQGAEVAVSNYGARIVSLLVPDRDGGMADVVLGFDSIGPYKRIRQNYGATVGRYLGRINGARYVLDGEEVQLQGYGQGDISHGGRPGFANRVWTVEQHQPQSLRLRYVSPHGESGFPGTLSLAVTMTITDDNALRIDYEATTDRPTVLNPSNHSFFNLSGEPWQPITGEQLWVNGDSIAEFTPRKQVSGRLLPVAGTPFDFRQMRPIGQHIDDDNAQLRITGGYDHAWLLSTGGSLSQPAAKVYDPQSGILLTLFTTEPAVHIYTANSLRGNIAGKQGIAAPRRGAICLETCHFSDSPNQPQFPSTVLRPGETFRSTTIFSFSAQ